MSFIISASRRTDIPAFYARWFMHRVRAGYVEVPNPFNARQIRTVSLLPDAVDAIVFWTRHASPLLPFLPELEQRGLSSVFQYTITGYPSLLEPHVPSLSQALDTFIQLSEQIGPERLIWRFDPVIISAHTPPEWILEQFQNIACTLEGHTRQVVISFLDDYAKTRRNLRVLGELQLKEPLAEPALLDMLCTHLGQIAAQHHLQISACAEPVDLRPWGIAPGHCISAAWLNSVFNLDLPGKKDPGQRKECGCIRSVDIGAYNTCAHGCTYCYATYNAARVTLNRQQHDEFSPRLIG